MLRVVALLVTLASVLALAACGSSSSSSGSGSGGSSSSGGGSGGQSVTLHLLQATPWKPGQELVDKAFEAAHPNIHIDATYTDNASLAQLELQQMQAGNGPDLMYLVPGAGSSAGVWPFAAAGRLMDFSSASWAQSMPAYAKPVESYQGKVYGLPFVSDAAGFVYNVDLFQKLKLSTPQTFSQLLSLCRQVHSDGKVMFELGIGGGATAANGYLPLSQILMAEFIYGTDPSWTAERNAHSVQFANSPLWKQSYQAVLDMQNAGCFNSQPAATVFTQEFNQVASGQAVGNLSAGVNIPAMQQLNPKLNLAVMPLPALNANKTVAVLAVDAIAANAKTKYPSAVKEFMNFMAEPAEDAAVAKADGALGPLAGSSGYPSFVSPEASLLQSGKVVDGPMFQFPNGSMWFSTVAGYIPAIVSGQKTIAQTLQAADYLWDHPTATSAP